MVTWVLRRNLTMSMIGVWCPVNVGPICGNSILNKLACMIDTMENILSVSSIYALIEINDVLLEYVCFIC